MLRLKPFDLVEPSTIDEVISAMRSSERPMLTAAGTDLVPKLKREQFDPDVVISLAGIPDMSEIVEEKNQLVMGALVTLAELEQSPAVRRFPVLQQAVGMVASPIIRIHGTLGGNLMQDTRCRYYDRGRFWRGALGYCMKKDGSDCKVAPGADRCFATLCSDVAPALIVLGAEVTIAGRKERTLPLAQLYQDDGMANVRMDGEILTRVTVPLAESVSVYKKLRLRGAIDFPEAGVAVAITQQGKQLLVRVAITAVRPDIVFFEETLERSDIPAFIDRVHAGVKPMDTLNLPPAYRKRVVRNLLQQALDELLTHP